MSKPLNQEHADNGAQSNRRLRVRPRSGSSTTSVCDLLVDLAHLCDAESLEFVEIVTRAIRHWQVERIDPASVLEGPVVEIYIGKEGLPPKPKPNKRPDKRKKSRPA